jgi:CheY-like chemotaxis protein
VIPEGAPVIEVLLVDDDQLMRAGLRLIVQQAPDLTRVGEAADGREAVAAARRGRAAVAVGHLPAHRAVLQPAGQHGQPPASPT